MLSACDNPAKENMNTGYVAGEYLSPASRVLSHLARRVRQEIAIAAVQARHVFRLGAM